MQMQEGPALVSFRNLQKSYARETLFLNDLNLDAKRGGFSTCSSRPARGIRPA